MILISASCSHSSNASTIRNILRGLTETFGSLDKGFKKMSGDTYEDLVLHDIAEATIKHDILVFLQHELAEIRIQRSINMDWPSQDVIQTLAEMAVPLFIFAATVCRFVGDNAANPKRRLDTILGYQVG